MKENRKEVKFENKVFKLHSFVPFTTKGREFRKTDKLSFETVTKL